MLEKCIGKEYNDKKLQRGGNSVKVFISHASEDKEAIAKPLAQALRRVGVNIWYDEYSLQLGDSLTRSIEAGLAECDYGIVIISPNFLSKEWTERELAGLSAKQTYNNKVILPILHNLTHKELKEKKPILSDLLSIQSDVPLSELVSKILEIVSPKNVDLEKIAPTNIKKLDQILGGGLRRRSSLVIEGPKAVGKTTLAIQIQKAALERGESGLYIAYSETPIEIIDHFLRMGCPIAEYIEKDKFRILDNYSSIVGISKNEVLDSLGPNYAKGVVASRDPRDIEEYYEIHGKLLDQLGMSVNIIDSTNARYELFGGSSSDPSVTEKYFRRFRSKGTLNNNIGIHTVQDIEHHKHLLPLVGNLQNGAIRLKFMYDEVAGRKRMIQVENIDLADSKWYEFAISDRGIDVF